MLQFFKKPGRVKRSVRSSSDDVSDNATTTNHAEKQPPDSGRSPVDDILLEAEKYCQEHCDEIDGTDYHQSFSKNIHQIVSDKNYLSYFIQFLDSQKALPLIKFWLDAESFKLAAEQCNENNRKYFERNQFKAELNDFYRLHEHEQSPQQQSHEKINISKSLSFDACNGSIKKFDQYDCDSISSSSVYDRSLMESSIAEQEDLKSCSSENKSDFCDSVQDINDEWSDMGKPLTDDEKSQLQNKSKNESRKEQQQPSSIELNDMKLVKIELNRKNKRCFESTLASDAIRIFKKYLTSKSTSFIDIPATILSAISLALCSNESEDENSDDLSIASIFVEAQNYVLERLDKVYLNPFIESSFYCKYCVDILTGDNLKIRDILYCESLLFYFMEYLEQENTRQYLDFWVSAINFKKLFNDDSSETYNNQQAQTDALVLYEKYFSLQATCPLRMSDTIRYHVEEKICAENGPITNCFNLPLNIIECYLDRKYFRSFLTSNLFYKYLSELLHKIDGGISGGKPNRSNSMKSISGSKSSRHRKTYSDCSNEKIGQYHQSMAPSTPTPTVTKNAPKIRPSSTSDMHIESKQLYNPDLLWSRRKSISGLQFGRVDALGRYERDFDLDPCVCDRSSITTKSSKIKQAVRKLVNLPEDKVQEEIAWQVAEMIVKDITNVTLNYKRSNSTPT